MEMFAECYPVFHVLGKEKLIGSDIPYTCFDQDSKQPCHQVQLVCKYLMAMKTNKLDQVLKGMCITMVNYIMIRFNREY